MALQENLREKRAKDTVGIPKASRNSQGSMKGTAKNLSSKGSTKGVGGRLREDNVKEEPVSHEPAYRRSDKNYSAKVQEGMPQSGAAYRNRDRQGTGLETQPRWQTKEKSYPTSGRAGLNKGKSMQ